MKYDVAAPTVSAFACAVGALIAFVAGYGLAGSLFALGAVLAVAQLVIVRRRHGR